MRRREFITLLGGAVAVWPLGAVAQQASQGYVRRRFSTPLGRVSPGLNEAGYVEGQNVAVEYRWAENQLNRLPALAADLVRRQVALGTGGWGDEIGAALTRGKSGSGFTIFNVQRL
jgi:putative ABC transport system substrate-binding protein